MSAGELDLVDLMDKCEAGIPVPPHTGIALLNIIIALMRDRKAAEERAEKVEGAFALLEVALKGTEANV